MLATKLGSGVIKIKKMSSFKGCTLNFLFILRCILTNLDLVVYRLRYYFRNVLKHFMTKLNH